MSLGDIGSWASIVGLIMTVVTLWTTANVNKKVNDILKSEKDKKYFDEKLSQILKKLKEVRQLAEDGNDSTLYSTRQYSKINEAIQIMECSWDILFRHENKKQKDKEIQKMQEKCKRIRGIYGDKFKNTSELIELLNSIIIVLEKEQN